MNNPAVLIPVLLPLMGAALGLLFRRYWPAQIFVAFASLIGAFVSAFTLLLRILAGAKPFVYQMGAWRVPFGITFIADLLSLIFVCMSLTVFVFGLIYIIGAKDKCVRFPAFIPLYLTLTASLCGGFITGDLFNLFVFAELLVISAAVLTSLSDDRSGAEAAWKYFYISTIAGLLLLGANACMYAAYGTLNMADLARHISDAPMAPLLRPAAAMLICALLIKGAIIPFHFWQPDFHTVAPTPISAVLSSIVVKLGVYGLMRGTTLLLLPLREHILPALTFLGIAGILFGGLAAAGTHNAKRVLAYSTLAQIGFILAAMGLGSELALTAAIIFSVNHALIKAALLMLAGVVASRAPIKSSAFDNVVGVGRVLPAAGWLFILGGMALVGMPPLNGFVSKFFVLSASARHGEMWLVVLLCLASVITLIYVVRTYTTIWWEPLPIGARVKAKGDRLTAPAALIFLCLLLGIFPRPLTRVAERASAYLQDPSAYINAVLNASAPELSPVASTTPEVLP